MHMQGASAIEPALSLKHLADRAATRFIERFAREARWIVAAPGRVNLIGEHTDYNGGFVLPMAIERYVAIAADQRVVDPATEPTVRLFSSELNQDDAFSLASLAPTGSRNWSDYVRGVVAGCIDAGMDVPAFDAIIDTTVPVGGGLSSSAALEVATATLLETITGHLFEPREKARLCQKAEHEFAGMPCGIMDQTSSVMGQPDHLMLLDCRSLAIEFIPLNDPAVTVLIINSNVKHQLTGSEYPTRRAQCQEAARLLNVEQLRDATLGNLAAMQAAMEPVLVQRARHVISEIARTRETAVAISEGDWQGAGRLMYESHESLKRDFEVSTNELDLLVELARSVGYDGGMWGSRMTGGGFGGCTVSLVRTDAESAIADQICREYERRTGIRPSIFSSRPSGGPQVLRRP